MIPWNLGLDWQFLFGLVVGFFTAWFALASYYKLACKYYTDELYNQYRKALKSK